MIIKLLRMPAPLTGKGAIGIGRVKRTVFRAPCVTRGKAPIISTATYLETRAMSNLCLNKEINPLVRARRVTGNASMALTITMSFFLERLLR